MKRQALVVTLVLSFCLGIVSAAQAGRQDEPQAPRTRLRERIGDLYILRLTRALELTEDQTSKIYPVLVRVEKAKAELQRRMGLDMRDLRAELQKSPAGEGGIEDLVARIREARRAIREREDEVEAVLDGVLTPVQKGRFIVFQVEFLRSVGENLERARGARPPIKRTP